MGSVQLVKPIWERNVNMSELTIVIDYFSHKELKEYLMSLNGILDTVIENEEQLKIYIKYDSNLITSKIIKMEILLFLGIMKIPSILSFDKHSKFKTFNYKIIREDLCCEYCFKGTIDDLFEIDGIEKVESNFNEDDLFDKHKKIILDISYNPNIITIDEMKQIELNLNI